MRPHLLTVPVGPSDHAGTPSEFLADLRPLPEKALRVWYLESLSVACALSVTLVALSFWGSRWHVWLQAATACILMVTFIEIVLIPRRYRFHQFSVSADKYVSAHGRIVRHIRIQPQWTVLYVEVRQGPFLRAFNLYRVRIGSIAGSHVEGPMTHGDAQDFQRLLLRTET